MNNWKIYTLAAVIVTAAGFAYINNSHRNMPSDLRDAPLSGPAIDSLSEAGGEGITPTPVSAPARVADPRGDKAALTVRFNDLEEMFRAGKPLPQGKFCGKSNKPIMGTYLGKENNGEVKMYGIKFDCYPNYVDMGPLWPHKITGFSYGISLPSWLTFTFFTSNNATSPESSHVAVKSDIAQLEAELRMSRDGKYVLGRMNATGNASATYKAVTTEGYFYLWGKQIQQ